MTLIYRNRSRQTFSRSHGQLRCDWLIHCSCVMREKTPGGSAPSPSAALRPSVRRAWASAVRDWKERGSVMDRSHSTRLFSATLHCEHKHTVSTHTHTHTRWESSDRRHTHLQQVVYERRVLHVLLSAGRRDPLDPQLQRTHTHTLELSLSD